MKKIIYLLLLFFIPTFVFALSSDYQDKVADIAERDYAELNIRGVKDYPTAFEELLTGKAAYIAAKAGADIVVTGTVVEEVDDVQVKIQELTGAIKKASLE